LSGLALFDNCPAPGSRARFLQNSIAKDMAARSLTREGENRKVSFLARRSSRAIRTAAQMRPEQVVPTRLPSQRGLNLGSIVICVAIAGYNMLKILLVG
jgi:hypothetical protein